MKNLTAQAVYDADIYLRLSDDDGDKPESNSIKNQREFITEFLKSMPEIRIHAERKDDGFSGVDFFRPGIQEVLQDVRSGAVNCVVVKDDCVIIEPTQKDLENQGFVAGSICF